LHAPAIISKKINLNSLQKIIPQAQEDYDKYEKIIGLHGREHKNNAE
jgi:hypothetical protein